MILLRSLSFLLLFFCTPAYSNAFFDPLDGQLDFSEYLSEHAFGFLPVPIVITDPAVDGGFGLAGLFFHESQEAEAHRRNAMSQAGDNAARHLIPPNVSLLAAAATGNDSKFIGGGHMGFFKNGRIRYTGGLGYGDINLDFFGFNDIEFERPVEINTQAKALIQALKFRVGDNALFLGISQRYIKATLKPNDLGSFGEVLPPAWRDPIVALLTSDITTSGLGLVAEYDSRDNIFTPTQGYRYQLQSLWFDEQLGSDIDYQLWRLEGLNFWALNESWRLGIKLAGEYADANDLLPPYATPSVQLRGIPSARYQGNLVAMTEAEVTWVVNQRWRILAFSGLGKAASGGSEFSTAPSRRTLGAGFRYQIARRYGFDMGLDIAVGPEDSVFYITAGSAW